MADSSDSKLAEIHARIQTQRKIMEGNQSLRSATHNQDVIRQAEAQIRDAQRNISYLEESLRTLQGRRASGGSSVRPSSGAPPQIGAVLGLGAPGRTASPSGVRPGSSTPAGGFSSSGMNSSASTYSNLSSTTRGGGGGGYPGDSGSSYFAPSVHGDSRGGSPGPGRYDERPLPLAPADRMGAPGGKPGMYGMGGRPGPPAGYGTPAGNEPYSPHVNRMGTSARKNITNLGEHGM